jgi:mono/diheme cytochrome c family protein
VIRRMLITLAILAVPAVLILVFSYEVVGVDFDSFMENQTSIKDIEGPHWLAPTEAVPVSRPLYPASEQGAAPNPVRADEVSLQRGGILFNLNCAVCHGADGQGNGPVTKFWGETARRPANLMAERVTLFPDDVLYTFVSQGIGAMPPLRENLSERQRWDVINYVRSLQAQAK